MLQKRQKKLFYAIILLLSFLLLGSFLINKKDSNKVEQDQLGNTQSVLADDTKLEPKLPPVEIKDIKILVYHSVAPAPVGRTESLLQKRFRVDPQNFKKQMQYLELHGYEPITFDHLVQYLLYNESIPEKPVVLTFDDGLLNQYENAVPILKEFGFVGTFFIYPGVTSHRGFMNWAQLAELVDFGHEIGSHTIIHYNLTTIDSETLQNELVGSKQKLEEKLGISVSTLAYPHYAENEIVRQAVSEASYIGARAGWRSIVNSKDEILLLKSQEVGNTGNPFVSP